MSSLLFGDFAEEWQKKYFDGLDLSMAGYDFCYSVLRDITVGWNSMVFLNDKPLLESQYYPKYFIDHCLVSSNLLTSYNQPVGAYLDKGFLVSGWGTYVYGHFLIEMLPKVLLYQKEGLSCPLILDSRSPTWLVDILVNHLGVDKDNLYYHDFLKSRLSVKSLYLPSATTAINGVFNARMPFYFDLLKNNLCNRTNCSFPEKIYVSRLFFENPNSVKRSYANQFDISRIIVDRGYYPIFPSQLSWPLQVAFFSNANVIIGEQGSGLHNTFFSSSTARVGQIGFNHVQLCIEKSMSRNVSIFSKPIYKQKDDYYVDTNALSKWLDCLESN